MNTHTAYMRRAIELALQGLGTTSPNPLVGAVLVYQGQTIAEGYHQKLGEAHAEVNAIQAAINRYPNANELFKQSTLYVTLEPCAHFGKTPPCADLIVRHEIPKVVIGCRDPFPQVDGKGVQKLKNAGIEIIEGILEKECLALNKRFFTRVQQQRPYIILKWAQTSDGYFAPKSQSQRWISSIEAKQLAHRWRSEEDAILVGTKTALIDNPQLNVRLWAGRNPIRIVIDRHLSLPADLYLFDQSVETIVFNELKTDTAENIKYLQLENFDQLLPQMIAYQLYLMDIQSLMIEGGAQTLNLFIRAGLWDEARIFTNSQTWRSGIQAPAITGKSEISSQVGPDMLTVIYNH